MYFIYLKKKKSTIDQTGAQLPLVTNDVTAHVSMATTDPDSSMTEHVCVGIKMIKTDPD